MQKSIVLLIALCSILLGCSNSTDPDYNSYFDSLTNLSAKESIEKANEWKFSAPKIKTHVTTSEAIFEFPDGRIVKKSLPDNLMYLGIAPYINTTHTCNTHYPSNCDGEIKEQTLKIKATDESGNVIYNSNIATMKNGFFELWLPRNKSIKLQVEYNSLYGEETIPTNSDSRTCITTIKLK